ncbi:MAG: hypothetical protein UH542_06150 [Bacteroidales bacterium]|nr:hypothetical protein [Bacteroidales bacterium]
MKKSNTISPAMAKVIEDAKKRYAEEHGISIKEVYLIGSAYTGWTVGTYEDRQAYFDSLSN